MGKIIIEFDSVEESQDARVALDAMRWKIAMWDLDQLLRSTVKYGSSIVDPSKLASDEEVDYADKIRELIRDILADAGLNLED
jgi:uncharacterized protein YllA (UPF0747 family)